MWYMKAADGRMRSVARSGPLAVVGIWQRFTTKWAISRYVGFMMDEGAERVRVAYGANYARLVEIKNRYDPDNLFRVNQNIEPTA
jgi:hypothetical protein